MVMELDQPADDLIGRQDLIYHAAVDGRFGHSIHRASFLVLGNYMGAGLAHSRQALGAVFSHAGEHDADGVGFIYPGYRLEKACGRGTLTLDRL